jgi:hypothetical protein
MDPITVLAAIKTAHATIKTAIGLGKDIVSLTKEISDIMNGVADLSKLEHDAPRGWLTKKSPEQLALEAFAARKEAEQLQHDVRGIIVSNYGLNAWDTIQADVVRIRKEQAEARRSRILRRAEQVEVGLAVSFALVALSLVVWIFQMLFFATPHPYATH